MKKAQIIEILENCENIETASNELIDLFYNNQMDLLYKNIKMHKKYFAWLNEISQQQKIDKNILHDYLKHKFLSKVYEFNGERFISIKSFKDLTKKDFLEFMKKVSDYFLSQFNIQVL